MSYEDKIKEQARPYLQPGGDAKGLADQFAQVKAAV
jgi:hypothetical protein